MKKQKLSLSELKITSFITSLEINKQIRIKGGTLTGEEGGSNAGGGACSDDDACNEGATNLNCETNDGCTPPPVSNNQPVCPLTNLTCVGTDTNPVW